MRTDVVMLAAGLSSRMGPADKMLLPFRGMHLCSWCCTKALDFLFSNPGGGRLIVVTGYKRDDVLGILEPCFERCRESSTVSVCESYNPLYKLGQFSSAKTGVRSVSDDTDFFITLADMPDVKPNFYSVLIPLLDIYDAVRPFVTEQGYSKPGHPVLLSRRMKNIIAEYDYETSMKDVLNFCNTRIYEVLSDSGWIRDIDTPNDL